MSDDLIDKMVDRFLQWKLPEDFSPDAGISFKRNFNEHLTPPMRHEPTGTNLLNAKQAEDMVRYITEAQTAEITRLREQLAEAKMKSLADLGQAQEALEAQREAERQRDAARADVLEAGLKRAAEDRATFCTAMVGTDEEFRAYLDGFDAAIRALIKGDRT